MNARGADEARGATAVHGPDGTQLSEVGPRTWCLRMPVDLPIRYTHCYLVVGHNAALVIDPGWDVPGGADRIVAALHELYVDPDTVVGVVATHAHRDHVGLAQELAERLSPRTWVGMHTAELAEHAGAETLEQWRLREDRWMRALGVPRDERTLTDMPEEAVKSILRTTRADRVLVDGDILWVGDRMLRVLHTPGHSPGSLCLEDQENALLFTGDTLLPRISPNVGWAPHGDPDPLADYLASLRRFDEYARHLALPGHEWPFTGVAERARFLREHHSAREDEILATLVAGDTAWALARRLTWSRNWESLNGFQRRIAAAETAAHLRHLMARDEIIGHGDAGYAFRHVAHVLTNGGDESPAVVAFS